MLPSPTRFYSCSSRPLCNAKRSTLKNGAVVELVAEEVFTNNNNNSAASQAGSPSSSVPERAEQGGITRCCVALAVRKHDCYNRRSTTHCTVDVVADIFTELARNEGSPRERL